MDSLMNDPPLGHITTFGGHPVCCAAGKAAMQALLEERLTEKVRKKEELFLSQLKDPNIKSIRSFGLWMAIEFDSPGLAKKITDNCLAEGVFVDWFLFAPQSIRISPPLTISEDEVAEACKIILKAIKNST